MHYAVIGQLGLDRLFRFRLQFFRKLRGKYPGISVVIDVVLLQSQDGVLICEVTLHNEDILIGDGSVAANGVAFQSQVIIRCAEFADVVAADQGSGIDLTVTDDLNVILSGSVVVNIPVTVGQAVVLHSEIDSHIGGTVGTAVHQAVVDQHRLGGLFRFRLQLFRKLRGEHPGITVVINVGLFHSQRGLFIGKVTLDNEDILGREGSKTANGVAFQSQVVIGCAEFADVVTANRSHGIDLTVTNDLNVVGSGSVVINIPVTKGQAVVLHSEIDAQIGGTQGTAARNTVRKVVGRNRILRFGSQLCRKSGGKHPFKAVVVNIGLVDGQGIALVHEVTLDNDDILGGVGSKRTNGVAFQSQVITIFTKLTNIVAANLGNGIGLAVTDQLNIVRSCSIIVNIPVTVGQAVVTQAEMDAALSRAALVAAQDAVVGIGEVRGDLRRGSQFLRKQIRADPGCTVMVNIGLLDRQNGVAVDKITFHNEHITGGDRCSRSDGKLFQSEIIIRQAELTDVIAADLRNAVNAAVTDELNIVGRGSAVVYLPVAVIGQTVILHSEVDTFICGAVGAGAHHAIFQNSVIIRRKFDVIQVNGVLFKLRLLQLAAQAEIHVQAGAVFHHDHFKLAGIALGPVSLVSVEPGAVFLHSPKAVAVIPSSVDLAFIDVDQALRHSNAGLIDTVAEQVHSGKLRGERSVKGHIHRHPCAHLQRKPHQHGALRLIRTGVEDLELIAAVKVFDGKLKVGSNGEYLRTAIVFKIIEQRIFVPYRIQGMVLGLFHLGGGDDRTFCSLRVIVPAEEAVIIPLGILRDGHHTVNITHRHHRILNSGNAIDVAALQIKGNGDLITDPLGIQHVIGLGSDHRIGGHFLTLTVRLQVPAAKGVAFPAVRGDLGELTVGLAGPDLDTLRYRDRVLPVHIKADLQLCIPAAAEHTGHQSQQADDSGKQRDYSFLFHRISSLVFGY